MIVFESGGIDDDNGHGSVSTRQLVCTAAASLDVQLLWKVAGSETLLAELGVRAGAGDERAGVDSGLFFAYVDSLYSTPCIRTYLGATISSSARENVVVLVCWWRLLEVEGVVGLNDCLRMAGQRLIWGILFRHFIL